MAFESIPFGKAAGQNAMGMPVAFCNAIAFDLANVKRLVYVSGQLAVDADDQLVGVGDVGAQTEQVLNLVKRLSDQGVAVILISHNLADVFEVADDIAVLYLGQMVAQIPTSETTRDDVVGYITGTKTLGGVSIVDTSTLRTEEGAL